MRLCTSLSLCLAAAAALVPVSSDAAHADTADPPCAASGGRTFPLATRIRGGPTSYEAGGGYGTWYIDLTNTTARTCTAIHPVVVLVDGKRTLKPSQAELDFYAGAGAHPVTFETTDEQELVGVLDAEGFGGFTVAPGKTVSVKVRLAVAVDAASDQVTANAAVVQRRGEDGDWVGQSNDYRFGIGQEVDTTGTADPDATAAPEGTAGPDSTADPEGTARPEGTADPEATQVAQATPAGTPEPTDGSSEADGTSLPFAAEAEEAGERARELARTGPGFARGLLAAVAALLAVGGSAFVLARRRR
ncbi:hypothetical protein ACFZCP_25790 [Streptomyces sp. NPDC007971]|uniref:hypothetical protein n=1 Tax=Streptomyces sp. NPDC007971 TaxID=3364799 RepID=UPI0036E04221